MPTKIVFLQGSPRKDGNTRAMVSLASASAREQGALVDEIDVLRLEFKVPGCLGCQACQRSEKYVCAVGDQIASSVATLPEYDVIVIATPLYWWSYTAQVKIFIDRMYSLSKFSDSGEVQSALSGKTLALLATGGGPVENNLDLLERQWRNPATMLGCPFLSCLFPYAPQAAGALANDDDSVQKAREFGRRLAVRKSNDQHVAKTS